VRASAATAAAGDEEDDPSDDGHGSDPWRNGLVLLHGGVEVADLEHAFLGGVAEAAEEDEPSEDQQGETDEGERAHGTNLHVPVIPSEARDLDRTFRNVARFRAGGEGPSLRSG
jgi:hypothetical protein